MYSACTEGILNMAAQAQLDRDMGIERKGQVGHTYWEVTRRYNVHCMLHTVRYSLRQLNDVIVLAVVVLRKLPCPSLL